MISLPSAFVRAFLLPGAVCLVTLASTSPAVRAQSSIFEARFNDASGMNLQFGATFAEGVSGQPDDKSYSADLSTVTDGQKTPLALETNNNPVTGITEFTVVVWYKARQEPRNDATVFDVFGTVLMWEEKTQQWVLRVDTRPAGDTKPSGYWFRSGENAPLGSWTSPEQWNFIAMVWKKSDKKVVFYQGDKFTPLVLAKASVRTEDVEPLNENAKGKRVVGNTSGDKPRPFDGGIDNLRFYDKALTFEVIEKIRQADLKNKTPVLP